jgi:hypothetical protein
VPTTSASAIPSASAGANGTNGTEAAEDEEEGSAFAIALGSTQFIAAAAGVAAILL